MKKSLSAPIICGKDLVQKKGGDTFMLDPKSREIEYSTQVRKVYPLDVGEVLDLDGIRIEGLKAVHGPVNIRMFAGLVNFSKTPGPDECVGLGAIGFKIIVDGKIIVNLGDTVLQNEWNRLKGLEPDVLMIPIGGRVIPNTMNETEALEAVKLLSPKMVIPCHYNCRMLWMRNANPADDAMFKREVEKMGFACTIMQYGDEIVL